MPITEYLQGQIPLNNEGGVQVDENMKTNLDGVWAIGDIRNTPFKQAVVACSDGCIAAMSIDKYLNQQGDSGGLGSPIKNLHSSQDLYRPINQKISLCLTINLLNPSC
jgi:hypothetical protein